MGDLRERFEDKTTRADGCWLWDGATTDSGYGCIKVGHRRVASAHRVSWELHVGPVPTGMCVCHKCDVRNCVNPGHLFLGSQTDNTADRHRKGRSRGRFSLNLLPGTGDRRAAAA